MLNNNIIMEKIWQEYNLIGMRITATSKYAKATQDCYVQETELNEIGEKMIAFAESYTDEQHMIFGERMTANTPGTGMKLLPADKCGRVQIEVDIEIDDNDKRVHKCCFFVWGELGLIENMGKQLKMLISSDIGEIASLFQLD